MWTQSTGSLLVGLSRGMASARRVVKEKETVWNLNKPGGWDKYEQKTEEVVDTLKEIIDNKIDRIEEIMGKLQSEILCFWKSQETGY